MANRETNHGAHPRVKPTQSHQRCLTDNVEMKTWRSERVSRKVGSESKSARKNLELPHGPLCDRPG
jgi:hypothetical protein